MIVQPREIDKFISPKKSTCSLLNKNKMIKKKKRNENWIRVKEKIKNDTTKVNEEGKNEEINHLCNCIFGEEQQ